LTKRQVKNNGELEKYLVKIAIRELSQKNNGKWCVNQLMGGKVGMTEKYTYGNVINT